MFGISTLKARRPLEAAVPCPVRGCAHEVPPQPGVLRLTSEFKCPTHKLYLSETLYAHEKETDALLWTDRESLALLREARGQRPAPSLGLEASEDALLWNVFRWCERSGALTPLLERWTGRPGYDGRMLYWGWNPETERIFDTLRHARLAFDEPQDAATEPGLMVETSQNLFILAARAFSAGSTNAESTHKATPATWTEYEAAADGWAHRVLAQSCCDLIADSGAHQLLRLWLIGTWMAARLEKELALVYLTPASWGQGVLGAVLPRLKGGTSSLVAQATWEDLFAYISDEHAHAPGAKALLSYLLEKSAGYGRDGLLRRAFSLSSTGATAASGAATAVSGAAVGVS
jgi:hypothetical protein